MVVGEANGGFSLEKEVVLLVEGTANLLPYFETLRKDYLDPILEYLNGGPLQEGACFFGDEYGPNQYCLIIYGTKSSHNEDAVQLVKYTRNIHEFVKSVDDIRFGGGGAQEGSLLAEGLGFALQAFDDMKIHRQSANVQRNCIVVSNSPPFPQPTRECLSYQCKTVEQLAEFMAKDNINLSVISPRKLPGLQKVFDLSIRDDGKAVKDCSKDPRHLVCIQGLVLPGAQATVPKSSPQTKGAVSHPSVTQSTMSKEPNTSPPKAASSASKGSPVSINTNSPGHRSMMTNDPAPPEPKRKSKSKGSSTKSPQAGSVQDNPYISSSSLIIPGSQVISTQSTFTGFPQVSSIYSMPPIMMPPSINQQPQQVPGVLPHPVVDVVMAQQQQVVRSGTMPVTMSGTMPVTMSGTMPVTMSGTMPVTMSGTMQHPSEVIPSGGNQNQAWTGTLEWTETVKHESTQQPQKITRSLACHISVVAPGNSIKTDKWPGKLIMQLIPQHLLSTLGPLLQNCKTVAFRFPATDPESLKALYRVMALNGVKFAGCVHFAPVPGCDIKVLLLIYSPKKKAFVGLIPHDQSNFVSGIRNVLQKYRQDQFKKIQHQRQLIAAQIRQQQALQQTQQGFANPLQQFSQPNAALQATQMVDQSLMASTTMMPTAVTSQAQSLDGMTPSTQTSSIAFSTGSVGGSIATMTQTLPNMGIDQETLHLQALKQQQQQQQVQQQQQLLLRQKLQQFQQAQVVQQQQAQQQQQQQQQQFQVQQQQQQHQQQQQQPQQLQQPQTSQVQNQLRHLLQQVQNQASGQNTTQQQAMTPQQWPLRQRQLLLQHQRQQQSQQQQQQQQQQQMTQAGQMAQVQMTSAQLVQSQSQMTPGQVTQAQMTVQGLAQAGQQGFLPENMSLIDLLQ